MPIVERDEQQPVNSVAARGVQELILQRFALSGDSAEGAQPGALRAAAVPVTATAQLRGFAWRWEFGGGYPTNRGRLLWGALQDSCMGGQMRGKHQAVSKFQRRAFLLVVVLLVGLATFYFTGLAHAQQLGPNPTVLVVDNPEVSCQWPVPSASDAGQLGQTITVSAEDPIDFVLVKSTPGAEVVSAQFDTAPAQITLSEDVTSYVVFTCPATTTTSPTSTG
jgi:hypothetical protein